MATLLPMIVGLGITAGVMTTAVGFGGGLLLVVCFATVLDPAVALTLTSMALLFGNLHRTALLRRSIATTVLRPYVIGAVPGSVIGALVAVALPDLAVRLLIGGGVVLAFVRALGWLRWSPSARALGPAGAGIGLVSATSGGGGLLQGPLFMASGLTGDSFIATMSFSAVFIHLGRVVGYAHSGLVTTTLIAMSAVLTVALVIGNLMGRRLSSAIPAAARSALELGALTVCAGVALFGMS